MYYTILKNYLCAVCRYSIPRIPYFRISHPTAFRSLGNLNAWPLTTHSVVRQIVEHMVQPVTTQYTVFYNQTTFYLQLSIVMKE